MQEPKQHPPPADPIEAPPGSFLLLLSGASIVLTSAVISRFLEFITRTTLGRYFGPGDFGLLTSGIATLSILSAVVLLGLPTALVRFVGRFYGKQEAHKIPGLLHTVAWFVTLTSCLAGAALWILSEWVASSLLNNSEMIPVLRSVAVALPLFALLAVMSAVFQGQKDARPYVLLNNILLPAARLGGAGLAVLLGWQLLDFLPFYFVGALLLPVLLALITLRRRSIRLFSLQKLAGGDFQMLIRFSLPLLVGSLFGLVVWQMDILLLQREWGAAETGLYSAAITIGRLPAMILIAFGFMLSPNVAHQYSAGQTERMRTLYGRVVDLIFMLALPIAAIFVLFAPLLLTVFFGPAYVSAALPLRILAIGFFIHSITGPNGNTLVMMGRSRLFLTVNGIMASVTMLFYLLLIPIWGAAGTAVATVAGLLVLNTLFAVQLHRSARINPLRWMRFTLLIPLAIAIVVAFLLAETLDSALPNWLLLTLASIALLFTYAGFTLLFRIVRWNEIFRLRKLFSQIGAGRSELA